jgi:hypothetical protein
MQISAQRGARTWGRAVGFSGPSFSFVLAAMVLAACGCKDSTPKPPKPEDANPVNVTEPAALQEKARIAQAVATRAGVEPPPPRLKLQGGELATPEVLAAYNQELARLVFRMRDAPESLEELVRKWPMPRLPTAPAGKRIVYDPVYRVIRLDPP